MHQTNQYRLFCISLLVMMDDSASVGIVDADIVASVEGMIDDADILASVDGVNVPRYVPQAEIQRQADHELAKGSFHENLSSRTQKRRKKTPQPKQEPKKKRRTNQSDVDWEKVEKQEYESLLFSGSLVMVRGPWQRKGFPTRKIWRL